MLILLTIPIIFSIFTMIFYFKSFKDERPDLGGFGGRK